MKHLYTICLLLVMATANVFAQQVVVTDNITSNTTWTADTEYILNGLVFVDSTFTLTIEPGTIIKARSVTNITTGEGASALIVKRGAQIDAQGAANNPIIFTSEFDDLNDGTDLTQFDRGLWGGIIILGRATTNETSTNIQIEGIPSEQPALYGGSNDGDNSGTLRYVSIRHGGFSISGVPGDEINGLTMGAVGSGTTIEFVEVFANLDDGYEWFGGTVNTKYLVAAFCGDDSFDYDQGFRGMGQFWFSLQGTDEAGRAGEHDGGDTNETGTPFSLPVISNVTFIGSGSGASGIGGDGNDRAFAIRDNAGGHYFNSIFTDFAGVGMNIEDLDGTTDDSRGQLDAGNLTFDNNYWFDFAAGATAADIWPQDFVETAFTAGNTIADPQLNGISRTVDGGLDPTLDAASPALTAGDFSADSLSDAFFTNTSYVGAFSGAVNWLDGWTALSDMGFTGTAGQEPGDAVVVTDDITGNETWTSDNLYILNGLVFVDSLASLTIEPGTIVKARFTSNISTGEGASALIVRRGGTIDAQGSATNPIIFTSQFDDTNDPSDLTETDRGLWGGIILLGKATTNETSTNIQIEGIPSEQPALYGGSDDGDNSGTLRYISIRHGGYSISGVPGDEINGLTMGAVGSGTTIENIEVFANLDDCYEWFGGTVNSKYLVGAFCGDDSYDYDQGFRGKGQFWFSLQGADETGRAGEHDGGDTNETGEPFSLPVISNVTFIGSGESATGIGGDGNDRTFAIRDNAGGHYYNSIFTDFAGVGMNIEDLDGTTNDSRGQLDAGNLSFTNNLWFGFGAGNTAADIFPQDFVETAFTATGNDVADAELRGISRSNDAGLDPRLQLGSIAATGADFSADSLDDDFFSPVLYQGAFGGSNWLAGWTALDAMGFNGDIPLEVPTGEVIVTNNITANTTWTADNIYVLDGLVFVDGAELTIQAGTVIKGRLNTNISTGEGASALIVRRGATINAQGSADQPIIMTSEVDDVTDGTDLTSSDRGLWGGLIMLGSATTNETSTNIQIEGIPAEQPALYGGTDDGDDSGTLSYVSIRHGGFSISGVPGDEINGLTMGGVGSGTVIEYVEVYANLDDCFEWFGGTVNTKNLVGAFCGDDTYDYDQGFRGKGQFWFSIQGTDETGRAGEHDGGDTNETGEPFSIPVITNVTYIGSGEGASGIGGDGNDRTFAIRDNAGGKYYNSIFTDFAGVGTNIEDLDGTSDDSRGQLEAGNLVFNNNLWYGFGAGNTAEAILPQDFVRTNFVAANNQVVDPNLRGISRGTDAGLDPRLGLGSPASTGADFSFDVLDDDFFTPVIYQGAFGGSNWLAGWTAIDNAGTLGDIPLGTATNEVVVTDDVTANTTWTNDNIYILDGLVFVQSGELTIQPGTVVKGRLNTNITTGEGASALIVQRGATINAQGDASNPIIFTTEVDEVEATDRGLWGGLIILGRATTNETSTNIQVEGIPSEQPAQYGGNDDADNSGTLRYVSIRHGGFSISGVPGDEINGLTMGAVGSGTVIEYVEVFANLDDCFEWFGGTVNTKYLVGAFCGDDTFDYDQGFRGYGQYWFSIQATDEAGRAGEHDGGDTNETGTPFSIPVISHVTYIGSGSGASGIGGDGNDRAFAIRDNAGGKYYNSIFTDFAGVGANIEDLDGSTEDSRAQLEAGNLVFENNIWFNFGAGATAADIWPQDFVETAMVAGTNQIVDPGIAGISRSTDGGLNPEVAEDGAAKTSTTTDLNSSVSTWFDNRGHIGAFDYNQVWIKDWTGLDDYGYLNDAVINPNEEVGTDIPSEMQLSQNYPNPFNPTTNIQFALPSTQNVTLKVYNMLGQEVATLINNETFQAGSQTIAFDASSLSSGVYIYRLVGANTVLTKKMTLIK